MADNRHRGIRVDMKQLAALSALAIAACARPQTVVVRTVPVPAVPAQQAQVLTALPAEQIIPTRPVTPVVRTAPGSDKVTMTATNADVREILPALAAAAGISLVMTPDVRGRVSVNLRNVSATDALRAVIEEAGLTVGTSEIPVPYSPVVFYNLPVNINAATAATIKARYGVSDTVANWIVNGRNY